ncbi:MAG: TldD/PmbA family protein [Armatimonadota bacterium]|nr:TldD/PmbA family protein [Armatimonadota bacterium]
MSFRWMGEDKILTALEKTLTFSPADQTEVTLSVGSWALTRFANSYIHQNMASESISARVRVVFGKKVAAAYADVAGEDGLKDLISRAVEMARHQDDNPDFVSLPEASDAQTTRQVPKTYSDATAECTAEHRASLVRAVIAESDRVSGSAAGSLATWAFEHAVANSLGIRSYYRSTAARLTTVITCPEGGFGYASASSVDLDNIDVHAVGREASETARASANPVEVEPGEYECVLSPYAVAEVINYFVHLGFWARAFQEGRSFVCGRIGEPIVGSNISIWDDGLDPRTLLRPFDAEGVAKKLVRIVDGGIASELLYDSYAAHRERKKSTGHAGSTNPIMSPGDATMDQMIATTERGLFVTRFHYTNVAHLMSASITGMTRDGTFLIEDGRITKPVKNMRFMQSLIEALANVEMIGRNLKLVNSTLAPAMKVKKWRFVSATEF